MIDSWYVGDIAEITETFSVAPTSVSFNYFVTNLKGDIIVPITGAQINPITGGASFFVDINLDYSGVYYWRWASTGTGKAASEGSFIVEETQFADPVLDYDRLVLADFPVLYMPMSGIGTQLDLAPANHVGTYHNGQTFSTMPNGDTVTVFDGATQYLEIPDANDLSPATAGVLTFEAWIRPDVDNFPNFQSTGYVHWMGKGVTNQHEWVARRYNLYTTDVPPRPHRTSGYAFNLAGGTGVGAFFQDSYSPPGEWIHYACTINTVNVSGPYPTGYTTIFKNGVQRNTQSLSSGGIVPQNGTAPMRVGTRDFASYFQGAIGKVAVYNYELTPAQLLAHYNQMVTGRH